MTLSVGVCRQMIRKALESLTETFDGAKFLRGFVAQPAGGKEHAHGHAGLPALGDEGRAEAVLRAGDMVVDQKLWLDDFDIEILVRIIGAVRPVHDESPGTAGAHIHFLDRAGKTLWPPPRRDVLRICPGFPNQIAWRVEKARGHDVAIGKPSRCSGKIKKPFETF